MVKLEVQGYGAESSGFESPLDQPVAEKISFNPAVNESGKVKESERRGMASLSYTKPEIWKTSNTHCPNGH